MFSIMHVFSNEPQLFPKTQSITLSTVLFQQIVVGLLFCFVHLNCVCFHKLSYIVFHISGSFTQLIHIFTFQKFFWGVHGGHLIINKIARGNHVARTKQPNTNQTLVILYTYSIKKKPFFKHTLLNRTKRSLRNSYDTKETARFTIDFITLKYLFIGPLCFNK